VTQAVRPEGEHKMWTPSLQQFVVEEPYGYIKTRFSKRRMADETIEKNGNVETANGHKSNNDNNNEGESLLLERPALSSRSRKRKYEPDTPLNRKRVK